jgi:hypothetical protein
MNDLKSDAPMLDTVSAHEADLRRQPRQLSIDGSVLKLAVRPEFRGRRALLVDVSTGGIGFLLEDTLEPGTVLAFDLQGGDETAPATRVAKVRHARPHPVPKDAPWIPPTPAFSRFFRNLLGQSPPQPPMGWLIGCEFDRPLSDAEVKQLLAQIKAENDLD